MNSLDSFKAFCYCFVTGICICVYIVLFIANHYHVEYAHKRNAFYRLLISSVVISCQDILWTLVNKDIIPKSLYLMLFCNYLMTITCFFQGVAWLLYSFTISGDKEETYVKARKILLIIFACLAFIFIPIYMAKPEFWIQDGVTNILLFILVYGITAIFILVMVAYCIYQTTLKKNYARRKEYWTNAIGPLVAMLFAIVQIIDNDLALIYPGLMISLVVQFLASILFEIAIDPLTGINNRNELRRNLITIDAAEPKTHILMMMDLNHFKIINDTYGHIKGDEVLTIVSQSLKQIGKTFPKKTLVYRYGGDEFLIILQSDDVKDAYDFQKEINQMLKKEDPSLVLILSMGASLWDGHISDFQSKLQEADEKMYEDKARMSSSLDSGK